MADDKKRSDRPEQYIREPQRKDLAENQKPKPSLENRLPDTIRREKPKQNEKG